jgi:hypothetical protein
MLTAKIILSLFVSNYNDCLRRLVNLGRKLCLFMYYLEDINNKQWMVKKIVT